MHKLFTLLALLCTLGLRGSEHHIIVPSDSTFDAILNELLPNICAQMLSDTKLENAVRDLIAWRLVEKRFLQATETLNFDKSSIVQFHLKDPEKRALRRFAAHAFFHGTPSEKRQLYSICWYLKNHHFEVKLIDAILTTEYGRTVPVTTQQAVLQSAFPGSMTPDFVREVRHVSLTKSTAADPEFQQVYVKAKEFFNKLPLPTKQQLFATMQGSVYKFATVILDSLQETEAPNPPLINPQIITKNEESLFSSIVSATQESIRALVLENNYSAFAKIYASLVAYFQKKESLAVFLVSQLQDPQLDAQPNPVHIKHFEELIITYLATSIKHSQNYGTALPLHLYRYFLDNILPVSGTGPDEFNRQVEQKLMACHTKIIPLFWAPENHELLVAMMQLLKTHPAQVAQEIAQFIEGAYHNCLHCIRPLEISKKCSHSREWSPFLTQTCGALRLAARRGNVRIIKEFAGALPDNFFNVLLVEAISYHQPKKVIIKLIELMREKPERRPVHGQIHTAPIEAAGHFRHGRFGLRIGFGLHGY
jgi:hypothetical protein